MLCAPAVIIMLAVAAFPMGYAIYLSLERYDLRFPHLSKFIGLLQLRDGAVQRSTGGRPSSSP